MATSAIYYKFRSQREPQRLTFDGTGISVWELKREIILQNKMGKGVDFDLAVYDADTDEEYKDDNFSIPRSSHVIVRRLPPSKPGRGTAQLYVADLQAPVSGAAEPAGAAAGPSAQPVSTPYRGPMSKRFDVAGDEAPVASAALNANDDEASRIAAMFQATTEQWDETQERMAHATYRERSGMPRRGPPPGRGGFVPSAIERPPPPAGYICYRCGQKGHWIQECPTNDNQEYDNRPRFKRTTGIPKSMLRTVEQSTAENMSGVMVTPDGSYVVATPDSGSWNKTRARSRPLSKTDVYQSVPSDPSLACPLCSKLLREAVKTSCCQTTFCEECIQTHLFEHDFVCAECEKRIPDIEMLKIDDVKRKQVREYVDKAIERSEDAFEQGTGVDEEVSEAAVAEFSKSGATGDAGAPSDKDSAGPSAAEKDPQVPAGDVSAPPPFPPMPGMPGSGPPQFNPQMVQQLVTMLQNPNLPMPMRMQLQMQLQFQQMLFFQAFSAGGMPPGMPPMPGGPEAPPDAPALPGKRERDDEGGRRDKIRRQ